MPNSTKRPRGRPRRFDKAEALQLASEVFRRQGYAGTSIDNLTEAMRISKPSLYGTYGDKAQLYLLALEAFAERMGTAAAQALNHEEPLQAAIVRYLDSVLDIYFDDGDQGLGCLIMSTAATEAPCQPTVRDFLADVLARADDIVARRIQKERGVSKSKLSHSDIALARIVTGILISLGTRARSGESREELHKVIVSTAGIVSGATPLRN